MDLSQSSISSNGAQVQGAQGHHHKHKSITDQISSMSTAIDNAVKAGKLTDDQAAAMKKKLDDVKQTIGQNQSNSSGQSSISQLSDADKKKVFGELQDVRKELHSAMGSQQGASAGATSDQINQMFTSMDSNGDGNVSKDEFASFLNTLAQKGSYNAQGSLSQGADGSTQGGLSVSA